MHMKTRRIGPIGTTTRLLAAAGLLYLAFFDGASRGLEWYDAAVGLGVLPGRRRRPEPARAHVGAANRVAGGRLGNRRARQHEYRHHGGRTHRARRSVGT